MSHPDVQPVTQMLPKTQAQARISVANDGTGQSVIFDDVMEILFWGVVDVLNVPTK